jgi:ADP-ribose pyrophosphatase YjhB (NUDIX family)
MNTILEISDKTFGIGEGERYDKPYLLRKTARMVLMRDDGKIALQHVANYDYYKLPGGGVEAGESVIEALHREISEEVGCRAEVLNEIGTVIEYRNQFDILQISYCYLGRVIGDINEPSFDEGEIADGMSSLWVSADDALALLQKVEPVEYEVYFMVKRDLEVLKAAKKLIEK